MRPPPQSEPQQILQSMSYSSNLKITVAAAVALFVVTVQFTFSAYLQELCDEKGSWEELEGVFHRSQLFSAAAVVAVSCYNHWLQLMFSAYLQELCDEKGSWEEREVVSHRSQLFSAAAVAAC